TGTARKASKGIQWILEERKLWPSRRDLLLKCDPPCCDECQKSQKCKDCAKGTGCNPCRPKKKFIVATAHQRRYVIVACVGKSLADVSQSSLRKAAERGLQGMRLQLLDFGRTCLMLWPPDNIGELQQLPKEMDLYWQEVAVWLW